MVKFLPAFLIIFFSISSFAQRVEISGTVKDTSANSGLANAVVMAIRFNDSLLIKHVRTDASGYFKLNDIPIDTYQVIVTHPRFGDQMMIIAASEDNKSFALGKFSLPSKSVTMREVLIYAYKDPVYYKGDTLIFTADSFKVKPNATVEDLLKKLPGMKVDAAGKITLQGKEISQVLVDGDEFFGSDATIATKNLSANTVESVQVYEKKNENASETGGEEMIKVMNLKLKDDAKKGYFGKVSASTDAQRFYEGELLVNKFKNKQKISVFALGSNTPRSSFGWNEINQYGLSNEMNWSQNDNGDYNMAWNTGNNNSGIPQTLKSGFYYSDKISSKTKVSANYSYNTSLLKTHTTNASQYFLSDTSYNSDNVLNSKSKNEAHGLNLSVVQNLDSLTDLTVDVKSNYNMGSNYSENLTNYTSTEDVKTRTNNISNNNKSNGYTLTGKLNLNKKFKKKDMVFNAQYRYDGSQSNTDGVLMSENIFYNSSIYNDSINQKKTGDNSSNTHHSSIQFTEPFSQKIKLESTFEFTNYKALQDKKTMDFVNGEYSSENQKYSNRFENTRNTSRLGLKLIYETKKHRIQGGTRLRNIQTENLNLITDVAVKQNVNNILPFASYRYKPNQNTNFSTRYNTNSSQPSISQLQPVPDNSNPNQITLGNPNLVPTFSHDLSVSFNGYKPISEKYYGIDLSYKIVNNDFANSITYDSIGRTISKTVNVNGNNNLDFSSWYGIPLFNKKIKLNPNARFSNDVNYSFINDVKNKTTVQNYAGELFISYELDNLEAGIGSTYEYYVPSSTSNSASNKPYSVSSYSATFQWEIPKIIGFSTDARYTLNGQRANGYNVNYVIWNAAIKKTLLKSENLILSFTANDILNQNTNVQRVVKANVITDTKTNIIARYFLFNITFKFKNKGAEKEEEDDGF